MRCTVQQHAQHSRLHSMPWKHTHARQPEHSAMNGPTSVADLLSTGVRGGQAPHEVKDLLLRLSTDRLAEQQLLSDAQGVEVLVHLLQHKEPSLQLEACLALACINTSMKAPSYIQQPGAAEPLVAALAGGLLHSKQPTPTPRSISPSSTSGSSRPTSSTTTTSSSHTVDSQGASWGSTTWQATPRLAAAAFLSQAPPSTLEELCQDRPALVATLAQLAVDQVEGALHGAVVGQQQQQQPWQLPAASAAMAGLLQLLCGDSQLVHSTVVHQVCRLAYSTAVLDQLGVGLAGYPGAVTAVVALVQPWSQEGFRKATGGTGTGITAPTTTAATGDAKKPTADRVNNDESDTSLRKGKRDQDDADRPSMSTSTSSASTSTSTTTSHTPSSTATTGSTSSTTSSSSSHQWLGGAPQLQAEAAATLLVLASLGKGSRELVTRDAATVATLLQAVSNTPWGPYQLQEQQVGRQRQCKVQRKGEELAEEQAMQLFRSIPSTNLLRAAKLLGCVLLMLLVCVETSVAAVWRMPQLLWPSGRAAFLKQVAVWVGHLQRGMVDVQARCASLSDSGMAPAARSAIVWCWDSARLCWGVCYELLVWARFLTMCFALHLVSIGGVWIKVVKDVRLLALPSKQWVILRQQWAAYCLWHLCTDVRSSRKALQQHADLSKQVFEQAAGVCLCTAQFLVDLKVQAGWLNRDNHPAAELRGVEPPPPPHLLPTWRCRLHWFVLTTIPNAWTVLDGSSVTKPSGLLLPPCAAGVFMGLGKLPLLGGLGYLSTLMWWLCAYFVLAASAAAVTGGMLTCVGAAAAVLLTVSSRLSSYQVVVASRPAPAAAPPRTWLQPVSYLATDLWPTLAQEGASSSLAKYECFGQWPAVAPFHRTSCTAQHVAEARREWLSQLLELAWWFVGFSVIAGGMLGVFTSTWAARILSAAAGSWFVWQWVWAAWAASVQLCCAGVVLATVLVQLCCVALQPSYLPLRMCVWLCWRYVQVAGESFWRLAGALAAAGRRALQCAFSGMLSLPSTAWRCIWAGGLAVCRGAVSAASAIARLAVQAAAWPVSTLARVLAAVRVLTRPQGRSASASGHAVQPQQEQPQQEPQHTAAGIGPAAGTATPLVTKQAAGSNSSRSVSGRARGASRPKVAANMQQEAAAIETPAAGPPTDREGPGHANSACGTVSSGAAEVTPPTPNAAPPVQAITSQAASSREGATRSTPHQASTQQLAPARDKFPDAAAPSSAAGPPPPAGTVSSTSSTAGSRDAPAQPKQAGSTSSSSTLSSTQVEPDTNTASASGAAQSTSSFQQQQQEAALADAQQAAQGAARVAAAAAAAASQPFQEVHLAAARAAAEALQGAAAEIPSVEGSMLVVQAAAAAAGLYAGGHVTSAAQTAAPATSSAPASEAGDTSTARGTSPAPAPAGPAAPRPRKPRSRPECVVCLDARPSVTTHPCGHRVLCGGCAALVAAGKGECPMCRAPVVRYEAGAPARKV